MWTEILWGSFIGAVLSIAITAFFERMRKPSLSIKIIETPVADYSNSPELKPARKAKFLYLSLINNDINSFGKWFSTRETAINCHGVISFHRMDGTDYFGRDMTLRWTNLPNPSMDGIELDLRKIEHSFKVDVSPGEDELFNVAAKFDDEEECYGWSNRSFFKPHLWRDPEWKLPFGCYLIRVKIITSGNTCERIYRLINDVPLKDFRLDPALPNDKIILRQI